MIQDGYSVCFNKWALDTRIKNELPLLLIISSLSAKTGECFAGNKFFSELFNCTEVSISSKISKLIDLGYIEAVYEKRGAEVKKRTLRLKSFLTDDLKSFYPTDKKVFKEKNTIFKNTNNNTYLFDEFWKEYPKQRAGSKDKAYRAYVKAIEENRTTEQKLLDVVKKYAISEEVKKGFAKGCAAWLNDDRFNNEYSTKEEKSVKIEVGTFYLDSSMSEYKDVTTGMTDEQCESLWKFIYDKFGGQTLSVEFIKNMIRKANKSLGG